MLGQFADASDVARVPREKVLYANQTDVSVRNTEYHSQGRVQLSAVLDLSAGLNSTKLVVARVKVDHTGSALHARIWLGHCSHSRLTRTPTRSDSVRYR